MGRVKSEESICIQRNIFTVFFLHHVFKAADEKGGGSCAIVWFGARYYFLFNAVFSVFVLKGPDTNLLSSVECLDCW